MAINRIDVDALKKHIDVGKTILVPNLRTKDAALFQILDEHKEFISPTPKIFPIDVFIQKLWELNARTGTSDCSSFRIMSSEEESLIWESIIEAYLKSTPLLNITETSAIVSRSYQLTRQWISNKASHEELINGLITRDTITFSEWTRKFQNSCQNNSLISLVDAIESLISLIGRQKISSLPEKIVLVNFHDSPPLYQRLFNVLPNTVYESTTNFGDDVRENSRSLIEAQNIDQEVAACANWATKISLDSPEAHIGILVPEKEAYRVKLERALHREMSPDNLYNDFSMQRVFNSINTGIQLSKSALIYDAFLILNLCKDEYPVNDIVRLLQSPFIVFQNEDDSWHQECLELCTSLRELSVKTISYREFTRFLEGEESIFVSKIFLPRLVGQRTKLRDLRGNKSPVEWVHYFEEFLQDFGWPNNTAEKPYDALLKQWNTILHKFKCSCSIFPNLDYEASLQILHKLCNSTQQKTHFDGSLPISFLSINESVSFEYDYVWLLGMNDSQWPRPANPSPFIPYSLQKSLEMPSANGEIELKVARAQIKQIVNSTKTELVASYHMSDDKQRYQPSRLVEELDFMISENRLSNSFKNSQKNIPIEIETIFNESLTLSQIENISGGAELLSDQSRCPFKSFASRRLHVSSDPTPTIGVSKLIKGTALHIALEKLFTNISSSEVLQSLSETEIESLIQNAVKNSIRYVLLKSKDIATPKIQKIESHRISTLLRNFINHEKKQPQFRIASLEKKLSAEFKNIQFNIRIDRIDEIPEQGFILIDYKSGKHIPSPRDWRSERPSDMQLPLYYTICKDTAFQPISAVLIANLNIEIQTPYSGASSIDAIKIGVQAKKSQNPNISFWNEITEQWTKTVKQLITEITNGECNVDPINQDETCKQCGLQALCRRHELASSQKEISKETDS